MLVDNHGRNITYLRLAVTDRCNLRCTYCMPEEGINYLPKDNLMTFEEMLRMARLFAAEGINKIRITGGEPFLRKDLMHFLESLTKIKGIDKVSITSNGTLLSRYLPRLKEIGITNINLSIDSVDKERFFQITRRDELDKVMSCMDEMLEMDFNVKLNAVAMKNRNIDDIIPLINLTKNKNIDVRFIEEMPFNGNGEQTNEGFWSYQDLLFYISEHYPEIISFPMKAGATAMEYQVPGHRGKIGIIAAYSRTFCGSCNRIRVTPLGVLKTCLYDQGIFNVKDIMRQGANDKVLIATLKEALAHRAKDGHEAERYRGKFPAFGESMASIGG